MSDQSEGAWNFQVKVYVAHKVPRSPMHSCGGERSMTEIAVIAMARNVIYRHGRMVARGCGDFS